MELSWELMKSLSRGRHALAQKQNPTHGRSSENDQRRSCWDRRRPRLPASNLTKNIAPSRSRNWSSFFSTRQARTPAVPERWCLIYFTISAGLGMFASCAKAARHATSKFEIWDLKSEIRTLPCLVFCMLLSSSLVIQSHGRASSY